MNTCLLAEAPLAERALVGLLLVVDVADVTLQVGRDGEGALAEVALVRLLPRVRPQVSREVGRPREGLSAVLAAVPLFLLLPASARGAITEKGIRFFPRFCSQSSRQFHRPDRP